MKPKTETRLSLALFLLIVFGFAILSLLTPDHKVSLSERRELSAFPTVTRKTLSDGSAMRGFSAYIADQFPMRETLRALKGSLVFSLYRQLDNDGIYLVGDAVGELDYPLSDASVENFITKLNGVYERYLHESSVYFALVPDKNFYLAAPNGYPTLDYDRMCEQLSAGLGDTMTMIDLFPYLRAEDYYRTDTHWRSERLGGVAATIGTAMGFSDRVTLPETFEALGVDFYGVYASRAAVPLASDTIFYPTGDAIRASRVTDLDKNVRGGIYWGEGDPRDRYTFFLNGASSLLTLENPLAQTDRTLVLFRDSFGSSLAPWLVEAYAKITLVDIRYLRSEMLGDLIDFAGSDVLFLYSTSLVNHSETLK